MIGKVKKFDAQGFGIIEGADGSKLPFVRSDFSGHQLPRAGLKVVFSIRNVKGKAFADNVSVRREDLNAW